MHLGLLTKASGWKFAEKAFKGEIYDWIGKPINQKA